MQTEDLDYFRKWFLDYVNRFSSSNSFIQENIKLKIEHTERVCENILLLSKAEKIGEEGYRLAETIALFHDLGRFEQFTKYKTFKDSESENHALLGIKVLKNTGILSQLPMKEKDLIVKAVQYHNLMEIPKCAEKFKELLFYSRLIRDADKLDILKLMSEDYKKEEKYRNPALEFDMPDNPGCSGNIVADILNNRMPKLADARNQNDVKLLRLSWIFDINFPVTFALLKERGYIGTILSSMPGTQEANVIRKHLDNHLNEAGNKCRNRGFKP